MPSSAVDLPQVRRPSEIGAVAAEAAIGVGILAATAVILSRLGADSG